MSKKYATALGLGLGILCSLGDAMGVAIWIIGRLARIAVSMAVTFFLAAAVCRGACGGEAMPKESAAIVCLAVASIVGLAQIGQAARDWLDGDGP